MKIWDTHAHLYMFDDVEELILNLYKSSIGGCICPAVDFASSKASIELARKFPGIIGPCIGLHPNEEAHNWEDFQKLSEDAVNSDLLWAIGETGLDYYRTAIDVKIQQERFIAHIRLARLYKLPLIVHIRDAASDAFSILSEYAEGLVVIWHSFTETIEWANKAIDKGIYISFSGIVTFKNAQELRATLARLPLDRLLIETDAPYLAPEPYRGKKNCPSYVIEVAKIMSALHNKSLEVIVEHLCYNTRVVFPKIKY